MRVEAAVICVQYGDFLAHTLPGNKQLFDRMVVVTDTKDRRTADICEHYGVECVRTDAFYANEKAFDKAAGINAGLAVLDKSDWLCHLDADIVLPPRSREILGRIELDPDMIYGCDRLMCPSFEDWAAYVAHPEVQHSVDTFIQANAFPLGARVGHLKEDGWCPIGFFQLWHAATGRLTYPAHGAADRSDMAFSRQWPRGKRAMIPELVAIHLATEDAAQMGSNWRGRVTPHFSPDARHSHTDTCITKAPRRAGYLTA